MFDYLPKKALNARRAAKARNKEFVLFGVIPYVEGGIPPTGNLPDDVPLLTIAPTMLDAVEYVNRRVRIENEAHYLSWCRLHGYDSEDPKVWAHYGKTIINFKDPKNIFTIITLKYRFTDMATMCRIIEHCLPIGCSYDDEREFDYLDRGISVNPNIADCDDPAIADSMIEDSTKSSKAAPSKPKQKSKKSTSHKKTVDK